MNNLIERTNRAYERLTAATAHYHSASQMATVAKTARDEMFAKSLSDGTVAGSNTEKRQANFRDKFPEYEVALVETSAAESVAKLELDLARIEVEHVRLLVRLTEMEAGIERKK